MVATSSLLALLASVLGGGTADAAPVAPRPAAPAAPTIDQVNARLAALGHEVEKASEAYNEARERLASTTIKVRAAQVRMAQQQAVIAGTRQQMAHLASVVYRQGELSALDVALSDDPESLLARAGLGTTVADRQAALVESLRAQEADLAADRAAALAEQKAATATQAAMAEHKKAADATVAQVRAELSRLQAEQRRALARAAREEQRKALEAVGPATSERSSTRSTTRRTSDTRSDSPRDSGDSGADPVTPGAGGTVSCGGRTISAPNSRAARALAYGCAQLGEPYAWGADGPGSWDCSGFTLKAWGAAGVSLPHSSRSQYSYGTHVSRSSLQPGDLVFFYSPISHVGMYIGNGMMIHAPRTGDVVKIESMFGGYVGGTRL